MLTKEDAKIIFTTAAFEDIPLIYKKMYKRQANDSAFTKIAKSTDYGTEKMMLSGFYKPISKLEIGNNE